MSDWILQYDNFVPRQERLREALCTLGNSYFATRGAAEEAAADREFLSHCGAEMLFEIARYRSHWLDLTLTHGQVTIAFRQGWARTAKVGFKGHVHEFEQGETKTFVL